MALVNKQTMTRTAVVLCGVAMLVGVARAQSPDAPPPPPDGQMQGPPPGMGHGDRGPGGMNPERRLEMMQKQLNLTPDQTTQIKGIMTDGRNKMESLRANHDIPQEDRRAQGMALRQDERNRIKAVLTPDQQSKLAAMEEHQREHGHYGSNGQAAPPPPPSTPQQ